MPKFSGFPEGKIRLTPVPALIFTDLLPEIDHLGELKVILYALWKLDRMEGTFRYLRQTDFSEDTRFMQGMGEDPEQALAALAESLDKAVKRATLLKATVVLDGKETELFFLNTPKGQAAVGAIQRDEWRPSGVAQMPIQLELEKPNIFRLYEEHIGPLTPMLAEELKEAEDTYPPAWIEDAVRISVENNKRSWRYILTILERWHQEGRDERKDRRDTEKARRRYSDWET